MLTSTRDANAMAPALRRKVTGTHRKGALSAIAAARAAFKVGNRRLVVTTTTGFAFTSCNGVKDKK